MAETLTSPEQECLFCAIAAGQADASMVYQDEIVVVFMSLHPVVPGHLLVVPRKHAVGSLHSLPDGVEYAEPTGLFEHRPAGQVLRDYLAEVARLAASTAPFEVLAHIDYPIRSWPESAGSFDPRDFEDEFRHALRETAKSGRALEVNTKVPLHGVILRWWHEEGGEAISFGSDAHDAASIARGFSEAAHMAD